MRVIFFGCTKYSEELLNHMLNLSNIKIEAIFSIPEHFKISYSDDTVLNTNFSDLSLIAKEKKIDFYWVNSEDGKRTQDYYQVIEKINPDIILVLGWYYMVPKQIRNLAKYGAWGIHASLLPKYAGGAPLVWAMIEGQDKTGVSLFKLDDGVDDGDLIEQESFRIEPNDTIKEVYEKATIASKNILKRVFDDVTYKLNFKVQEKSQIQIYPQRSPKDGEIDWNWDNERIKNFIKAQTKPYPGAWTKIGNKKIIIWSADIIEENG
jgi:methionyl-tRNA formyltransferase